MAIIIRVLGLWWLNAARIVYVIDEPRRFGFAYGTLPGHAERGEERFSIEWLADEAVIYDIRAFSRPRHWAARLAYPLTRCCSTDSRATHVGDGRCSRVDRGTLQ